MQHPGDWSTSRGTRYVPVGKLSLRKCRVLVLCWCRACLTYATLHISAVCHFRNIRSRFAHSGCFVIAGTIDEGSLHVGKGSWFWTGFTKFNCEFGKKSRQTLCPKIWKMYDSVIIRTLWGFWVVTLNYREIMGIILWNPSNSSLIIALTLQKGLIKISLLYVQNLVSNFEPRV